MCDICQKAFCDSRCPNKKHEIIGVCRYCGEKIFDYESKIYIRQQQILLHDACFEGFFRETEKPNLLSSYVEGREREFYIDFCFENLYDSQKINIIKDYLIKTGHYIEYLKEFCLERITDFEKHCREG